MLPDKSIFDLNIDEFDSLLLIGAMDIREAIESDDMMEFIRKFSDRSLIIGAISIAPVLLLKLGALKGKRFMAGVNREDLLEEGFTKDDMAGMVGWDDNLNDPVPEGYIITDNIITSVSYNFVKWALGFGKMLGLDIAPSMFGM